MGDYKSVRSSWRLDDCKILAADPKSAIMLHMFLSEYISRTKAHWRSNKHIYYEPSPIAVDYYYRAVIEWEKITRPCWGKTLVQYKKIREISQYEFIKMFSKRTSI